MRTELLKGFLWLAQGRVNSRNSCEATSGREKRLWARADAGGAYGQHAWRLPGRGWGEERGAWRCLPAPPGRGQGGKNTEKMGQPTLLFPLFN